MCLGTIEYERKTNVTLLPSYHERKDAGKDQGNCQLIGCVSRASKNSSHVRLPVVSFELMTSHGNVQTSSN